MKKCVLCKNVNNTKSEKFCSIKCQQKYWYENNKEKEHKKHKDYYEKNKNEINKKRKLYWENNKGVFLEKKKLYYIENKEVIKLKSREYQKENKIKRNNRTKIRRETDIAFKLKDCLRGKLTKALKRSKTDKCIKTLDLLGCSIDNLKIHLESKFKEGMSWENHGTHGWHIDHIKPCASFDLTDPEQQKICFHYTNMQPLWWWDNLSKGIK